MYAFRCRKTNSETSVFRCVMCRLPASSLLSYWRQRTWRKWTSVDCRVSSFPPYNATPIHTRLDGFLRRLYKRGFTVRLFTTEQLLFDADNLLFRKVLIDGHCLHHLLPPVKALSIQLRPASHNCQLPICTYMLYKQSFLARCHDCH